MGMRLKRIVVGTDLTPRSNGAVDYATDLAAAVGASLHIVNVVSAPIVTGEVALAVPTPTLREMHDSAGDELEQLAARTRAAGVEAEVHVCDGAAADMLCKIAETVGADLIVVGNKHMQGVARMLGSVANRVAHHAPCSVLIADTGN